MYFFAMIIYIKMQEDAPLVMVRLRVVKLLGHLGGKINRNLVTGKESLSIISCAALFYNINLDVKFMTINLLLIIVLYFDT